MTWLLLVECFKSQLTWRSNANTGNQNRQSKSNVYGRDEETERRAISLLTGLRINDMCLAVPLFCSLSCIQMVLHFSWKCGIQGHEERNVSARKLLPENSIREHFQEHSQRVIFTGTFTFLTLVPTWYDV